MHPAHTQRAYRLRFDWGLAGARAAGADADVVVVVDVLSFTTTLSVAVEAGMEVLPYRWNDGTATRYAAERQAVLAVGRSVAGPGEVSLSPATIRANAAVRRVLLPSPNGSTISLLTGASGATVVGASLRNFSAVARWITRRAAPRVPTVAVIAAGERWDDGSLRPAVEDLWGAGAVIRSLQDAGLVDASPEAEAAVAAYAAVEKDAPAALRACASGRELIGNGYAGDVEIAAEIDRCPAVPVLSGAAFVAAS
ncbi:2-phosphosulfolactate phosphatase [Actinoplanes sp. NPDC049668]|uniref:2-phosphosulfolactate phosphatase n=1 Tax=unclassified Actinoplanes TaxID=2626549 RepID=UPI0033A41676